MKALGAAVLGLVLAAVAPAVMDQRALIEQALDEPGRITLENTRLGDAIAEITRQTGVRVDMPPEVMRLVPHGADTLIQRVQIANMPLRQGLHELFTPLGMQVEVREDHVAVVPSEGIRCLGRAPTWEELDLLAQLTTLQPGTDETDLAKVRSMVQFHVAVFEPWPRLAAAIQTVGAGTGVDVLHTACRNLGWAWCPADQRILITGREQQVRRLLQQPVSLRMNNRALADVLLALGRAVHVAVRFEPGSLAALPAAVQKNFSLNVQNESAETVLEKVAAYTGLGYLLDPDGVLFFAPGSGPPSSATQPQAVEAIGPGTGNDPYVGKVVVALEGGKTIEWLIRRSELPPDLRERREQDVREAFEALRRQMQTAAP